MLMAFVGWLLGFVFKDDPLNEEEMGHVPNAMDGIDDEKD